jgi:hypothetical protein
MSFFQPVSKRTAGTRVAPVIRIAAAGPAKSRAEGYHNGDRRPAAFFFAAEAVFIFPVLQFGVFPVYGLTIFSHSETSSSSYMNEAYVFTT